MQFAHLTLATPDVRRTSRFFREAFGWTTIEQPNDIVTPTEWLSICPGQELHLVEVPDFSPTAHEKEFGRHVAFFHPRADFPALRDRLRLAGAELISPERDTPFERFFFRDPDGYVFEVIDADRGGVEESPEREESRS